MSASNDFGRPYRGDFRDSPAGATAPPAPPPIDPHPSQPDPEPHEDGPDEFLAAHPRRLQPARRT